MRHRKSGRKLGRTASHRKATLSNLSAALFERKHIKTTEAKAKETRRVSERLITLAKKQTVHARRLALRTLRQKDVVQLLFDEIAPRYAERPGGYTRVIKSPYDGSDVGQVAVAGEEEIEEATEAAVRAAEQMAALPRHARVKILRDTAHRLIRHQDELGEIICDEAGKPITYAKLEAARAVATFNASADLLTTRGDETIPVDCVPHGEGRTGFVHRQHPNIAITEVPSG